MAKFLTGNELNTELEKIFEQAEEQLILISPYIKLHSRYASALLAKKENHKLKITVVFGKNEENPKKSMNLEDLNFFKEFPNIEIRYEKRLHAKYYTNESSAILTSMNLYDYSQDNNIEAGIIMSSKYLLVELANNFMGESPDPKAFEYFARVVDQSELIFQKIPQYQSGMLGLTKKYKDSKIEIDNLSEFFSNKQKIEPYTKNNLSSKKETILSKQGESKQGYCINTCAKIPFNIEKPMCYDAWQKWKQEGSNPDFKGNYCHFSGELSQGLSTKKRPVLNKNWKKANEIHGPLSQK